MYRLKDTELCVLTVEFNLIFMAPQHELSLVCPFLLLAV